MSKSIIAVAMAAALVGCATAPAGYDAAQWRKDWRECSSEAKAASDAASSPGQKIAGGLGRFIGNVVLLGAGQEVVEKMIPDDSPQSEKWHDTKLNDCMIARGYPPKG